MQKTNNFNFLNSKNILLVSNDDLLLNKIKKEMVNVVNSLVDIKNLSMVEDFYTYDLIILDADMIQLDDYCELIQYEANDIPVMFLSSRLEYNTLKYSTKVKLRNVILKNEKIDYIKFYIAMILDKSTIIHFNNGFYYDLKDYSFYCNSKKIKLTNMEDALFKYLIENRNKLVTYEDIENNVWHNKKYSIYGMRNIINQIRDKSYYDIIKNESKNGYTIKDYHIFS